MLPWVLETETQQEQDWTPHLIFTGMLRGWPMGRDPSLGAGDCVSQEPLPWTGQLPVAIFSSEFTFVFLLILHPEPGLKGWGGGEAVVVPRLHPKSTRVCLWTGSPCMSDFQWRQTAAPHGDTGQQFRDSWGRASLPPTVEMHRTPHPPQRGSANMCMGLAGAAVVETMGGTWACSLLCPHPPEDPAGGEAGSCSPVQNSTVCNAGS